MSPGTALHAPYLSLAEFLSHQKVAAGRRLTEHIDDILRRPQPIERCLVIELHYGAIGKGVPTYEKETFEFRASLPMMWRKTLLR